MNGAASVDLVLIWHHHQPDYRNPKGAEALLPWVRLHATKDYLDMARRLERHPAVRSAFNFVPSLLDQVDDAARGGADRLFALLARDPATLDPAERDEVARRTRVAPDWAFDRWRAYAALAARVRSAPRPGAALNDAELLALETFFLLGWLDPMFHGEPEAAAAIATLPHPLISDREALLALHRRLIGDVVPAYRALAERGQIELSASPYNHPILPLLVDVRHALRARPGTLLPSEPFAAPEDAEAQIARALERHAAVFGARPAGLWPSEGSVSPEAVELAARRGVRWMASDEAVLWASLPPERRGREFLYRPWKLETGAGEVQLLFRDHELSDRIGFVYQRWNANDAAADFLSRLQRIAREFHGDSPPLVTVILDGENCWEHYADDGGPFLDALYAGLESAPEIRTRTPSEAIAARTADALPTLHTGSWIDADFHIWVGHPEKNRAWDHLGRARRALAGAGATVERAPDAWKALHAAEGSDWFWWFGDDHATEDRALFDRLFREHVIAVYERAGLDAPGELRVPITHASRGAEPLAPIGYVAPVLDGLETSFYEWHGAGRLESGGGGAMHRADQRLLRLLFGCDARTLFLRVDVDGALPPELEIEFLAPRAVRVRVTGLGGAAPRIARLEGGKEVALDGARAAAAKLIELALPREPLGLGAEVEAALIVHRLEDDHAVESLPADDALRFKAPGPEFGSEMWSA